MSVSLVINFIRDIAHHLRNQFKRSHVYFVEIENLRHRTVDRNTLVIQSATVIHCDVVPSILAVKRVLSITKQCKITHARSSQETPSLIFLCHIKQSFCCHVSIPKKKTVSNILHE